MLKAVKCLERYQVHRKQKYLLNKKYSINDTGAIRLLGFFFFFTF